MYTYISMFFLLFLFPLPIWSPYIRLYVCIYVVRLFSLHYVLVLCIPVVYKKSNTIKNVEIKVLLKYLSNFWRAFEMSLINFEINLMLTWPENIVIWYNAATEKETIFVMTDTKLYLPLVTLSTQYNAKLSQQLKSRFKSIIIWKKYQSKLSTQTWN